MEIWKTIQFSKTGDFIKKWDSTMEVQRKLGINQSHITSCYKEKRKTAGNYIWRYHYKSVWFKNHIPLIEQEKGLLNNNPLTI